MEPEGVDPTPTRIAPMNAAIATATRKAFLIIMKVKSRQKLAETTPSGLILARMQLAQVEVYYYGYWVYDPVADYYFWFPADVALIRAGSTAFLNRKPSRDAASDNGPPLRTSKNEWGALRGN